MQLIGLRQVDAEQPESAITTTSSSSSSHIALSTSSEHQRQHHASEPPPPQPHWTTTTAGTLHDLKKRRSRELQLRLFGCDRVTANGGGDASTDSGGGGDVHPSISAAEIYGNSNGSPPSPSLLQQQQSKLVQAAVSCKHCCRLM